MTTTDLLRFEAAHPGHPPGKDEAIRRTLGIGPARYYMLLNRSVRSPEGSAADPILARHLRERADRRAAQRAARFAHFLPTGARI